LTEDGYDVALHVNGSIEGEKNIGEKSSHDKLLPSLVDLDFEADFEWDGNDLVEDKHHAQQVPEKLPVAVR
jgi:hypothetical protein